MSSDEACIPFKQPEELPEIQALNKPLDSLTARLITEPDDEQQFSLTQLHDSRSAMARGLKEYIERQDIQWLGGRLLRFVTVHQTWAEIEDPLRFPSCSIVASTPAVYSPAQFSHNLIRVTESGIYIRETTLVTQRFEVTVWATDPVERSGLSAMLENAFEPVEFMSGFRLELPYYFNSRATFLKKSLHHKDAQEQAQKRWRWATFAIDASVMQITPDMKRPYMQAKFQTDVSEKA